jgi:tRNA1Val (adenine37-N6)-methyltransferase
MPNDHFQFKQFTIYQDRCAFKVGTDGVLLGAAADVTGAKHILDVGAGTGLISLMLAQRSNAEITSVEPDGQSFIQLSENVNRSLWHHRIEVLNTTIQDYRPSDKKFDLIVSNPPYFSSSLRNPDPRKSAARHSDSLSSEDLIESVLRLLEPDGRFQVIMPYVEGNLLLVEASEHGLFCYDILKIRPMLTSPVRRLVLSFSRNKSKPGERFLTIEKGERHDFTREYIELTKDFYLKF